MLRKRRAAAFLTLVFLVVRPIAAQDETAPAGGGRRAVEKGREGVALYEQGRFSDALERFQEADALYHSPVFVLYSARALRRLGRMLEARAALRHLVAERYEAAAPEPWRRAQSDAGVELAELDASVPSVVIRVQGASPAVWIRVDRRVVKEGERLELDPGPHRFVAADGSREVAVSRELRPGERDADVLLAFPAERPAPAPLPASSRREPPRANTKSPVVALVVLGVGGAGLVAGGVVGVMALNEKADVLDGLPPECRTTTCPPSRRSDIEPRAERARDLGLAADVLFIAGAALAATGTGILLFGSETGPAVSAQMVPGGGAVRARF